MAEKINFFIFIFLQRRCLTILEPLTTSERSIKRLYIHTIKSFLPIIRATRAVRPNYEITNTILQEYK